MEISYNGVAYFFSGVFIYIAIYFRRFAAMIIIRLCCKKTLSFLSYCSMGIFYMRLVTYWASSTSTHVQTATSLSMWSVKMWRRILRKSLTWRSPLWMTSLNRCPMTWPLSCTTQLRYEYICIITNILRNVSNTLNNLKQPFLCFCKGLFTYSFVTCFNYPTL